MVPVRRALLSSKLFLRLNLGNLARLAFQFFRAFSRSRKASCGAHLETSVHQGAFSLFQAFQAL